MTTMEHRPGEIHVLSRNGQRKSAGRRNLLNSLFFWFCMLITSTAVILLTVLLTTIAIRGWDGLSMEFLQNYVSRDPGSAGIKAALWGSVWICTVCGSMENSNCFNQVAPKVMQTYYQYDSKIMPT